MVEISYNGNGLSDEEKEKIFEMFYTSNPKYIQTHVGVGYRMMKI